MASSWYVGEKEKEHFSLRQYVTDLNTIRDSYIIAKPPHTYSKNDTEILIDNKDSRTKQQKWLEHDYTKKTPIYETFKAGFINATLLKAHIHQFRQMILDSAYYHVFGVAESRLGPVDNIIEIDGYSCIRQDRNTEV